jgi:hypothetical protein
VTGCRWFHLGVPAAFPAGLEQLADGGALDQRLAGLRVGQDRLDRGLVGPLGLGAAASVAAFNLVVLVIDSILFLQIAFGSLDFSQGQIIGNTWTGRCGTAAGPASLGEPPLQPTGRRPNRAADRLDQPGRGAGSPRTAGVPAGRVTRSPEL